LSNVSADIGVHIEDGICKVGKDLEGSGRGVFRSIIPSSADGTEENHEQSVKKVGSSTDIRNRHGESVVTRLAR
jgi:hypothetical protein